MKKEIATFAMGCFWSPDLLFSKIPGVLKTEVGYIGGDEKRFPNPTYEQVCTDETGYAEAVQVTFDSEKIDYSALLDLFWQKHNPTTLNRQGADVGMQYRSAIFYHSALQKKKAVKSREEYQKKFSKPIVTEIVSAGKFFPAEDYHQKYLEKRGKESCGI